MTRPVVLSPVYNALTGNVSMANLDVTFDQVAAAMNDLSNCSVFLIDTGAVNALAVNPAPATVNIDQGTTIDVLAGSTNTGPATLTIAGSTGVIGAITITDGQGNALTANTLLGNTVYRMVYIGSVWRAAGTLAGGGVGPGAFTTITASGVATVASLSVTQGGIVIQVPVSGASIILNSITGQTAINGGDGVVFWQINTNATSLQMGTSDSVPFSLYTKNLTRFIISALGNLTINSPDSGIALTIKGIPPNNTLNLDTSGSGAAAILFTVNAAGSRIFEFNQGPNTGLASVTLASTKPGGPGSPFHWITVNVNGVTGYIPVFSA